MFNLKKVVCVFLVVLLILPLLPLLPLRTQQALATTTDETESTQQALATDEATQQAQVLATSTDEPDHTQQVIATTADDTDPTDPTDTITLTFLTEESEHIGGGSLVQEIPLDETVTIIPPELFRLEWVFNGWNVDGGNKVDFESAIFTENTELTPLWLRLGAVSSGGMGDVSSADVVFLARAIAKHAGFVIFDNRIADINDDGVVD
ncbi:MAG: hypothetical protein FWG87_03130, partial [Defluviitaleaceae bacterium]|nr:hypothetical protein [Defluviitaleaceae bacterium]